MTASGNTLGKPDKWEHRDEQPFAQAADDGWGLGFPVDAMDRAVLAEIEIIDGPDPETEAFDQRERAREAGDTIDPRTRHIELQQSHVIVGDHLPERRMQW
jgi:hypothetical protein